MIPQPVEGLLDAPLELRGVDALVLLVEQRGGLRAEVAGGQHAAMRRQWRIVVFARARPYAFLPGQPPHGPQEVQLLLDNGVSARSARYEDSPS